MTTPRVRPTSRGLGVGVLGATAVVLGVLLGIPIVTQWALVLLGGLALGTGWIRVAAWRLQRRGVRIARRVSPHPTAVGRPTAVQVEVTAPGRALDPLELQERAAPELSETGALRARLHRSPGRVVLEYAITPVRRGRWPVGPLHVHRRDPFGVAEVTGPMGRAVEVAVRPYTAVLSATGRAFATDLDRSLSGVRAPSSDDVALRPYRRGDDLRRVHWRSTARRGEMVVRQDERAARRPASVLLDLPVDREAAEWSISLACSVAVALARAGHHVRLLTGEPGDAPHLPPGEESVAALLDQGVDLTVPADDAERAARTAVSAEQLAAHAGPEVLVAVVGELGEEPLGALATLGHAAGGRAVLRVRGRRPGEGELREIRVLERSGWAVTATVPGEDLTGCWHRVLAADPVRR